MPGLPMFGHGQIEGFYGEVRHGVPPRATGTSSPTSTWSSGTSARSSPLLHKRYLFAGVENFLLYDFFAPDGSVNEDVFAYSNRVGDERALVVYHNKFADARGWIRMSAATR